MKPKSWGETSKQTKKASKKEKRIKQVYDERERIERTRYRPRIRREPIRIPWGSVFVVFIFIISLFVFVSVLPKTMDALNEISEKNETVKYTKPDLSFNIRIRLGGCEAPVTFEVKNVSGNWLISKGMVTLYKDGSITVNTKGTKLQNAWNDFVLEHYGYLEGEYCVDIDYKNV